MENEINKIRWEKWRTKQDKDREKTYFYCWGENMIDTCEAKAMDGSGNYVYIYAFGHFGENRVNVSWQYEVCNCPVDYAWGYLTGTLIITADSGSITYIIDNVCSYGRTVIFTGLEESNRYEARAQISSKWWCSKQQDSFWKTFNRTIGCILSI